jgi:hypothetical protein
MSPLPSGTMGRLLEAEFGSGCAGGTPPSPRFRQAVHPTHVLRRSPPLSHYEPATQ